MVYQFTMEANNEQTITQGKLPIYLQVAEQISRQISAGHLLDGERLPAERVLAASYGITVRTLRKSLANLTKMGLLERRQGSGNYIRKSADAASLYSFFRLELPEGGGLPTAKLLSVERCRKGADLQNFGESDFGYRFRRVRYLDNQAAAVEEIWLDGSVTSKFNQSKISQSLYKFYKEDLGIWIVKAEDWVHLAVMPSWGIGEIAYGQDKAMGFIERFGWSQHQKKVEYSRTWYDPEIVRYVARIK